MHFYILSPEQSVEIIKRTPNLIGHDPIILVYDLYAPPSRTTRGYRGFRLNLGLISTPEQPGTSAGVSPLCGRQSHRGPSWTAIRRELYREGFDGMIKILREASTELI